MATTNEPWRLLLRQTMQRARSIESEGPRSEELAQLLRELEQVEGHYDAEKDRVFLETKRRLADLEELHNANRLSTVGTLTVGLAHEFGTPLGVVLARAQMIISDENDLAEARQDAEAIITQVRRMSQMCREVLDYARPKAPAKVLLDVVQIARQMIALLQLDATKRIAKLVFAGTPPPSLVLGDSSKLMQVLTNLIMNAAQAMPNGGTVTVSVEQRRIEPPPVHGLPAAEYICLHIKDEGTGIRSADLPHIFETFFTTKKQGEGTGLGLAVSHRIAREHGGWIGVTTEEGKGSTFTLYLPPTERSG